MKRQRYRRPPRWSTPLVLIHDLHLLRRFVRLRRGVFSLLSRLRVSENTLMAVLAVGIGFVAGLCNYAFRSCIDFFRWLIIDNGGRLTGYSPDTWDVNRLWAIAFPVIGAAFMLPFFIRYKEDMAFGFPRFLERVNLRGGRLPLRLMFTRGISSALTIGSGGSAGQEGPIAQIGGTAGSVVGHLLGMPEERLKVLIGCGVSGGVAATFNAPLAGVFFAHEIVLLSSFELSSFTSIVISSGMATVVSRAMYGDIPAFDVPAYQLVHPLELALYAMLGIVCGCLAALFITGYGKARAFFDQLRVNPLWKPLLGGFLAGCVGVLLPQVQGNGYGFIEKAVGNDAGWLLVTLLIVGKIVATCVTLGSGLPGGTFAPSLFIGSVTGMSFGFLANILFPLHTATPGAYALVGMGAFLASVTHAPMTGIFLLFEITGSYKVIIPIMLACAIGTAVARHFRKDGIDTADLAARGIDLRAGREQRVLARIPVRGVMMHDAEVLPESLTIRQFLRRAHTPRQHTFPLVNSGGGLTGVVTIHDFLGVAFEPDILDKVPLREMATADVITVTGNESLADALGKMELSPFDELPVVDPGPGGRVIGILSRREAIAAYNRAIVERTFRA
ncbi:chloride channel protein [Geobacter hydrogenophilus]|uniref:Chloride channel protein n=2 Tax=Geobacter hydrogenophilus TaxID=40983 RepID=A0A9W6FX89_9BACT|nr:chloride channel protein [Geobacter hydrogenophilus]MBT0895400.1 chloride channel protein [Geobacter hydrogenophilus]GLI36519.1 chloride channel protein [Geobacter hydrogenophilus]